MISRLSQETNLSSSFSPTAACCTSSSAQSALGAAPIYIYKIYTSRQQTSQLNIMKKIEKDSMRIYETCIVYICIYIERYINILKINLTELSPPPFEDVSFWRESDFSAPGLSDVNSLILFSFFFTFIDKCLTSSNCATLRHMREQPSSRVEKERDVREQKQSTYI